MMIIGVLIAIGAAIVFIAVGAVTLFGGANATQQQLLPGFVPDRPAALERLLSVVGLWLPVILIALFCLLAGIQILRVAIAAFL